MSQSFLTSVSLSGLHCMSWAIQPSTSLDMLVGGAENERGGTVMCVVVSTFQCSERGFDAALGAGMLAVSMSLRESRVDCGVLWMVILMTDGCCSLLARGYGETGSWLHGSLERRI